MSSGSVLVIPVDEIEGCVSVPWLLLCLGVALVVVYEFDSGGSVVVPLLCGVRTVASW